MGEPSAEDWQAELEQLFLSRLARLREIRQQWMEHLQTVPPELLEYALCSTYLDCVRLGVRAEARRLCGLAEDDAEGVVQADEANTHDHGTPQE